MFTTLHSPPYQQHGPNCAIIAVPKKGPLSLRTIFLACFPHLGKKGQNTSLDLQNVNAHTYDCNKTIGKKNLK